MHPSTPTLSPSAFQPSRWLAGIAICAALLGLALPATGQETPASGAAEPGSSAPGSAQQDNPAQQEPGAASSAAGESSASSEGDAPEPVRQLPVPQGLQESIDEVFGDLVAAVAYLPFYNIAPTLGFSTDPQLRTDGSGQPVPDKFSLRPAAGRLTLLQFAPDGQHVLGADDANRAFVWSVQGPNVMPVEGETVQRFARPRILRDFGAQPAAVTAMAANPALGPGVGGEVAIGMADGSVRLFRIRKAKKGENRKDAWTMFELPGAGSPITLLSWSADGSHFASGSSGGVLHMHDAMGQISAEYSDFSDGVVALAYGTTPDAEGANFMAGIDGAGALHLLRTNGSTVRQVPPAEGTFTGLWGLPGDFGYALLDSEGNLKIYGADNAGENLAQRPVAEPGEPVQLTTAENDDDSLRVTALAASGKRFALDLRPDGSHQILEKQPEPVASLNSPLLPLQLSPLGTFLAVDEEKNWLELTYAGEEALRHPLTSGDVGWDKAALSPDGSRAVVAYEDGGLVLWEWLVRDPGGSLVTVNIPVVVLWLVIGALVFTLMFRFVNVRMFTHAIGVVSGKFTAASDEGEVSHFQALASALSATVGLGNIAGVAIAISIGGPGATFWMIVAGLLGMSLKFTECTLGQRFRTIDEHGQVSGGPMRYLAEGMKERGLGWLGAPLAMIFTVFCIGGSLAGGNAFQVNQSLGILQGQVPYFQENPWVYGLIMAVLAGIVIIGGIRRIASTAEKIVPTMCTVYVLSALAILFTNISQVPAAFGEIVGSALSGDAVYGGAIGALITGFRRAAFSNEAGVGSAAIAHSAAKTPYAVREGIVALLEPFIDTVLVCTMTALVIVITGVYQNPEFSDLVVGADGAALTAEAFASVPAFASWFPWVLMTAVILFAFSTMISWSYYGERCWTNVFGQKSSLLYKIIFLVFVVLGSVVTAKNVLEFGDLMILLMAFPNIFGLYFLARFVRQDLREYETKMNNGEIRPVPKELRG